MNKVLNSTVDRYVAVTPRKESILAAVESLAENLPVAQRVEFKSLMNKHRYLRRFTTHLTCAVETEPLRGERLQREAVFSFAEA